MKLSELLKEHLQGKVGLQQTTADHRRTAWDKFIAYRKDVDMQTVTTLDAEKFQGRLLKSGLKEESVNSYIREIKAVFNWALFHEIIDRNPFFKLRKLKSGKRQKYIYPDECFEAMMYVADLIDQVILLCGRKLGLRRGEILNLIVSDIDFEKHVVFVQPKFDTKNTWPWDLKDREERVVPLVPRLERLLIKRVDELPVGQPYVCLTRGVYQNCMELKKAGKLSERKRKLPDQNFNRRFADLKKRATVETGTCHDLRRTFTTELIEKGVPLNEAAKLLGHASTTTTEKSYVGVRAGYLDRVRVIIGATGLEPATS